VTFKDGATTLGSGTLNGSGQATFATSSLTVTTHSITAVYGGDANFNTSTSLALSQGVNQASTNTTVGSSANPSVFGQSVTFTATVAVVAPGGGTPTGTVTFLDNGVSIGSGALNGSGQATYTTSSLAVGGHPITATYGGDSNHSGSTTSAALSQTVNNAPPPAAPGLTVGSPTRSSLTLNWTEDTTNAPVTSFDVLRCTGSSCTPTTVVASGLAGTTRSYRNSGLSRRTTYRFEVRANNGGGSTLSNIASGKTN
ncbi:MAG TPA: Ig-like domain repeat protein, partial [Bryobacterales bacterium]|nr:Ig-like domain repeat protein [Bryobacterales bacterium]